jgi:hypothetical protein
MIYGGDQLLTASFPRPDGSSWEARSKDHDYSSPAQIRVYAIGLKRTHDDFKVQNFIDWDTSSGKVAHPVASVSLDQEKWILTGGGALNNWSGAGNMLTASYPDPDPEKPFLNRWIAAGKDHLHSSPASITAYAIGIPRLFKDLL